MKSRWLVCLILAVFVFSLSPAAMAASGDKIVRTKSLDGLPIIKSVCALLGCQILGSLDILPGSTAPSSLFLVSRTTSRKATLELSSPFQDLSWSLKRCLELLCTSWCV